MVENVMKSSRGGAARSLQEPDCSCHTWAAEGAMVPNLVLSSQDIPSQEGLGAPKVRPGPTGESQGKGHGCPLGEIQWSYPFFSVMG